MYYSCNQNLVVSYCIEEKKRKSSEKHPTGLQANPHVTCRVAEHAAGRLLKSREERRPKTDTLTFVPAARQDQF